MDPRETHAMLAIVEKPTDKLGRATILLPVLAFLTFAIVPVLLIPGPENLRNSVALLALGALLVSGPFGAVVAWKRHKSGDPLWRFPLAGAVSGLALTALTALGMQYVEKKRQADQKALEERQKTEARATQ